MAIVTFDNNIEYQSGEAIVKDAKFEKNSMTIRYELESGLIIRENYRFYIPSEKEKCKAVFRTLLGEVSGQVDTANLVGKSCYVKLEERTWKDRTWFGVAEVLPGEGPDEVPDEVSGETDDEVSSEVPTLKVKPPLFPERTGNVIPRRVKIGTSPKRAEVDELFEEDTDDGEVD